VKPQKNGATLREALWLGWNNIITKAVTRYLIVTDYASNGKLISEHCKKYPDHDPPGVIDPIFVMLDRYNFVSQKKDYLYWQYKLNTAHGTLQIANMTTNMTGIPLSVSIGSTIPGKQGSSDYILDYFNSQPFVTDNSIFWRYKDYNCMEVKNLTAPDVCLDDWLVLEYECGYQDLSP